MAEWDELRLEDGTIHYYDGPIPARYADRTFVSDEDEVTEYDEWSDWIAGLADSAGEQPAVDVIEYPLELKAGELTG
jgi:hypothetical protein